MSEIENKIKWLFLNSVIKDMEEEREEGFHVTELVYECDRKIFYDRKCKEKVLEDEEFGEYLDTLNEESILTLWIGKKLHEMPISNVEIDGVLGHEFRVAWNGIVGRIDEIIEVDGELILLDKKSCRVLPNKPYDHHIRQVEIYSALLMVQSGIEINKGCILYIDVAKKQTKAFVFDIRVDKGKLLLELETRVKRLREYIRENKLPKPKPTWLCSYCRWFTKCVKDGW